MNFIPLYGFLCLTLFLQYCSALCYDEVEEWSYCNAPSTVLRNDNWYRSVAKWYIPLTNQIQMIGNAVCALGLEETRMLSQSQLERSCMTFVSSGSTETWTSFRDRCVTYGVFHDQTRPGVDHYTVVNQNNRQEFIATTYTTMTDNASYFVQVEYFSDGRKGFIVASPYKMLDPGLMQRIKVHLLLLGFRYEYFYETNYDRC